MTARGLGWISLGFLVGAALSVLLLVKLQAGLQPPSAAPRQAPVSAPAPLVVNARRREPWTWAVPTAEPTESTAGAGPLAAPSAPAAAAVQAPAPPPPAPGPTRVSAPAANDAQVAEDAAAAGMTSRLRR